MQENVSRADRAASFNSPGPLLSWSSQPPRGDDLMLEAELSSRRATPVDGEKATLERLGAVVMELYKAVSSALEGERETARQYIERADLFLRSEPSAPAGGVIAILENERAKPPRGGLAPWQIRRVKTHIEANLDASIRVKELAELAKLSSFHFCRAFRDSFGDSPHGYVMRRRLERAQGLMLATNASLGQIAADCGLADQAHFNKLFRRFVGESPGMWRRARATAPG
jgi:AraC family transcriptional regulator